MSEKDFQAHINYLCREKYYHSMQSVALDAASNFKQDYVFRMYNGVGLLFSNRVQDAIRELELLQSYQNVTLVSILALIACHKKYSVVDKDALLELDARLKEVRKKAPPLALCYAALFLFHAGKYEKSKEYADRSLKGGRFVEGLIMKGWIELHVENDHVSALEYFSSALELDQNNLDAKFGVIGCHKANRNLDAALNVVDKIVVTHPTLTIALEEKMKIQFAQLDTDLAIETANRILNADKSNLEALRMQILSLLCRSGKHEDAATLLQTLFTEMESKEPTNTTMFVSVAQLFSRVCSRNELVLAETFRFADKAVQLNSNSVELLTELGYQHLLRRNVKEATRIFQSATKLDESSVSALVYLMLCQTVDGSVDENSQQRLDLLYEIQGHKTPMLLLLSAKVFEKVPERSIPCLDEAFEIHTKRCGFLPYGHEFLKRYDPDFLLMIVEEYLVHCSRLNEKKGVDLDRTSGAVVKKCLRILEEIRKFCPGLTRALYLLARIQVANADTAAAIATLNNILDEVDPSYVDAHLLLAQIFLEQGSHDRASQILETGVSYDFNVRNNPLFNLLSGIVEKRRERVDESIVFFQNAMKTAGLAESDSNRRVDVSRDALGSAEKVSLYLELANAYNATGQRLEAEKVMQDAVHEFKGTSEESRIVIANAELALKNDDVDRAFDILSNVGPDDPYYLQAHTKLADLYLSEKRDKLGYTKCFEEIVEACPTSEAYLLTGDAYMSILEFDRAIGAYEHALRKRPNDAELASKMGRALVTIYRYEEAITYYKEAIRNPNYADLKLDLAELYIQLDKFADAETLLLKEIESSKRRNDDLSALHASVKQLLLLAKVKEKTGSPAAALTILKEARDKQSRVQRRVIMEQSGGVTEQKAVLCEICARMAELCKSLRDNDQAIQHYKEALICNTGNSEILGDLAKLYMQVNLLDQCEQTCTSILQIDPDNEAACIIMADLSFRKVDFETAMHHFKQLLHKQPTYWTALARLIEVARRTGSLSEVSEYLARAQQSIGTCAKDAGFFYCTALYEWYVGNLNAALRNFNRARLDSEWGQQSIYNMIEICIHPDDESGGGGDLFSDTADNLDSRLMAIEMAERLHKELKPQRGDAGDEFLNHRLLKNFVLLATKQKQNVERALQDFTAIATQDESREHVGLILGMASACVLLKQQQRARNHLKRVVKNVWTFEDAEHLERCWLLLADIYVQSNKYDMAGDLLKKVLQHNRSCVKAYEYAGHIAEKEQNYREAALNYDCAWRYGGSAKPAIGYKLAHSHMKCKHYADAMEICHQVLKEFPDYPKIRKDILDKSRNNLRT